MFILTRIRKNLKQKENLLYVSLETIKLPMATTGVFFPLLDIEGNKIQNEQGPQHGFIYYIIPLLNCSYIVLATISAQKDKKNELINYFLDFTNRYSDIKLFNYLMTYFFYNNDSIVICPRWYKSLESSFQVKIEALMNIQVGRYGLITPANELDFSESIPNFKIFDKKTNALDLNIRR